MELLGFHASIHSDGEQLKEYSIEIAPDRNKATCWIPSQSGKKFVVKCGDGDSSTIRGLGKALDLFIDGNLMERAAYLPHDTRFSASGVHTAENARRPFVFADIQTTDEDVVLDEEYAKPDEIGTIAVQLFLAKGYRESAGRPKNYKIKDRPPAVLNERTKKVGEHCVSLGDQEVCQPSTWYSMDYDPEKPTLIFEFRYRPIAMLQAQGVAPLPKREASPIINPKKADGQPPQKRQRTTDDEDIVRSMQAELERLRGKVEELEGKRAGPSHARVKRKEIKHEPADIIDLT